MSDDRSVPGGAYTDPLPDGESDEFGRERPPISLFYSLLTKQPLDVLRTVQHSENL